MYLQIELNSTKNNLYLNSLSIKQKKIRKGNFTLNNSEELKNK